MRMTFQQFANWLHQMPVRIVEEIADADWETAKQAKQVALRMSSGTLSSEQLARMGHPFARRFPQSRANPARINVQTGDFRSHWHVVQDNFVKNGVLHTRLINDAEVAGYLDKGTRLMIQRPIRQTIEKAVEKQRLERYKQGVARATRPRR